ncbi:hypothetical protein AAF712_006765 [Marasmius tenuissimus]|uniref:Fungal-type protein kinase domain-containing protein n=1 Tax=Marasmius tenuissimus TaxID=585030 RepID=A0ABR2ZWN6_9AGAR
MSMSPNPQLNHQRTLLRQDHASGLIECTPTDFVDTYSRRNFIDDALVDQLVEKLRSDGTLSSNGWLGLRGRKEENENDTFAPLSKVASAVATAANSCGVEEAQTFWVHPTPTKAGEFDAPGYRHLPDVRRPKENLVTESSPTKKTKEYSPWPLSVSMLGELKLHGEQAMTQTKRKSSLQPTKSCLTTQPDDSYLDSRLKGARRDFWFFCRSHIAMCNFDHHKDPQSFIKFLLAVMFGSREQLGWDPTVTRLVGTSKDGSKYVFYQYKIDGRTFHTIGNPICDLSAYHLISRATRVWEVEEVDGEDRSRLVLKDVWLYEDAKLEKEILQDLFSKLAELDKANKRKGTPTTYAEDAKPFF